MRARSPESEREGAEGLDAPLRFRPGVGPARADALGRLGLETVRDLLLHVPQRHEDRRRLLPVGEARPGEAAVLSGVVDTVRERRPRRGGFLVTARLRDPTGVVELVWFQQAWVLEWIRPGVGLHVWGEVRRRGASLQVVAPEFEVEPGGPAEEGRRSLHMGRIVPVYPLTRGLHQRFLRSLVHRCLPAAREFPPGPWTHFHPEDGDMAEALRALHFPESPEELDRVRERFVFEHFFGFASRSWFRRERFRATGGVVRLETSPGLDRKIRSVFPFELTADQERAVADIARDLRGPAPMYRLLQGDVGTGKTAVALYGLLVAVRGGCQGAIMAPTEVLAEQHCRTIRRLLASHPVRVGLLLGSTPPGERREVLDGLASGRVHIAVGTHALIGEGVRFRRLGLAVIDEQHRFGVRERQCLRRKGEAPHLLVMTATPIPRSLCMTCYGDLDLSVLRARPEGRRPVRTRLVPPAKRARALEFVRQQLRAGRQAYFVYPLVEESESLDLPAAVEAHRRLAEEVFPEFGVDLVHGQLPGREKDERLERFRRGETRVLVATVVVEVGIDVPAATVIYIENGTRFGLAQLHQLRGRVGRGAHPGWCLVETAGVRGEARARLDAFARTGDGFRLAEEDLALRGPGDYLGLRQSGRPAVAMGSPLEEPERYLEVRRLTEDFWSDPAHAPYRELWRDWLGDTSGDPETAEEGFWGFD